MNVFKRGPSAPRARVLVAYSEQAIRIILDRGLSALRPVEMPTTLALPADGDLAPAQAAQIVTALGGVAKIIETTELLRRIEALEARTTSPGSRT